MQTRSAENPPAPPLAGPAPPSELPTIIPQLCLRAPSQSMTAFFWPSQKIKIRSGFFPSRIILRATRFFAREICSDANMKTGQVFSFLPRSLLWLKFTRNYPTKSQICRCEIRQVREDRRHIRIRNAEPLRHRRRVLIDRSCRNPAAVISRVVRTTQRERWHRAVNLIALYRPAKNQLMSAPSVIRSATGDGCDPIESVSFLNGYLPGGSRVERAKRGSY